MLSRADTPRNYRKSASEFINEFPVDGFGTREFYTIEEFGQGNNQDAYLPPWNSIEAGKNRLRMLLNDIARNVRIEHVTH